MEKNNVILCDFRRTERHKRMNEISKIFNDTIQTVRTEGQCDISNEELYELEKEYNVLLHIIFYEKKHFSYYAQIFL